MKKSFLLSIAFIALGLASTVQAQSVKISCRLADFNADARVDMVDYKTLEKNFAKTGCSAQNNYCDGADMDRTGKVDFGDLSFFAPCLNSSYLTLGGVTYVIRSNRERPGDTTYTFNDEKGGKYVSLAFHVYPGDPDYLAKPVGSIRLPGRAYYIYRNDPTRDTVDEAKSADVAGAKDGQGKEIGDGKVNYRDVEFFMSRFELSGLQWSTIDYVRDTTGLITFCDFGLFAWLLGQEGVRTEQFMGTRDGQSIMAYRLTDSASVASWIIQEGTTYYLSDEGTARVTIQETLFEIVLEGTTVILQPLN